MSNKLNKEKDTKNKSKIKINKSIVFCTLFFVVVLGLNFLITKMYLDDKEEKILTTQQIYDNLNKDYEKESYKYTKILENDSVEDIYNYMLSSIKENEYYPTKVMDYMFRTLYTKATANEKINLFFLYYQNTVVSEEIFYDYFNINGVKNYFDNYWNGYDFNEIDGISNCRQKDIQYLLLTMKANGYYVKENFPEILIKFDWNSFVEKFSDILEDDYIDFAKLLAESNEMIVNPNMNSYNALVSVWYIHNYEDYIRNTENKYLKSAAQSIYEQHLDLFLGQYNSEFIIDTETNTLASDVLIAYQTYLNLYPNDYTSQLIQDVFDLINNSNLEGDLIENLGNLKSSFIDEANWLEDSSVINEYFTTETISDESQFD